MVADADHVTMLKELRWHPRTSGWRIARSVPSDSTPAASAGKPRTRSPDQAQLAIVIGQLPGPRPAREVSR